MCERVGGDVEVVLRWLWVHPVNVLKKISVFSPQDLESDQKS